MRPYTLSAGLAVLTGTALGDTAKRYCDSASSICYTGWTGGNGVTIGVAIPNVTVAPFDTVLQIVSPIANGWVGFAWGGTMPYVPLTIGWVNSAANTTIYSSRIAFGLSLPQPYLDAEYTYLKGTGYNKTHWTLNVRCKGCSQWLDVDGKTASLNPSNTTVPFAHALASKFPKEPANNKSTFNVHTSFAHWSLDLTQGQNANFDQLVAANVLANAPPASSGSPTATPTSVRSTTLATSVIPTSSPGPVRSQMPTACSGVPAFHSPVLTAPGWRAVKVAGGLEQPRGVVIDTAGNLLVIQNGLGITAHKIGSDGCLGSSKTVIAARNLNHGIAISQNGKTLYASSATTVMAWDYDAETMTVSANRTVVTGMDSKGHVTRTIAFPPKYPNLLIVSHGSNDNFDYESGNIKTARACVKIFDLTKTPANGYNYVTGGYQFGYGLRNEVGLAFDADGMVWGVENASDEIARTVGSAAPVDIHADNPADELNYLGDPSKENTQWYGYPTCYTVWKPDVITDHAFAIGDQFVLTPNATFSDDTCKTASKAATLSIQAHSAPLDAVFNKDYTSMYVTLHGSWNRNIPTGYKIIEIPFAKTGATGSGFGPAALSSSGTGYNDIFWNPDAEHCSTVQCFRPVSIAKDKFERMYVTSDSGGEGELMLLGRV